MPDATNNVYIDFTFSDTSTDTKDVDSGLTLASPDNIGAANIPVVFRVNLPSASFRDAIVAFNQAAVISGSEEINVGYYSASTTTSGFNDKGIEFNNSNIGVEYVDLVNSFFTPDIVGSGYNDLKTSYILGQIFSGSEDLLSQLWVPLLYDIYYDREVDFVGGFKINFGRNITNAFTIGTTSSGYTDSNVDLTFTGYVLFNNPIDIFSSVVASGINDFEATVISGGTIANLTDVLSTEVGYLSSDIETYCALETSTSFIFNTTVISGSTPTIPFQVASNNITSKYIECDVALLSIKIDNFSVNENSWLRADGSISVDILDDVFSVTVSGCYFKIDGQQVAVTASGIAGGQRIFYGPLEDFSDGPVIVTARGENSNGDVIEQDYTITFGYMVEYQNYERFGWNLGYGTQVVVRASAENLGSCPEFSADAFWFETKDRDNRDLGVSIVGVATTDGVSDIGAQIYPQSTAYFYGKVFKVVINARDFAGNAMEPFEFEYKIEDKP